MLENNPFLKQRAQELRKNRTATKQEKHLWYDFLRKQTPQFHRQVIMGNYIVDFYCPGVKLVIELDGAQHFEPESMEYDRERTQYLETLGCRVVRYTNSDIDRRFEYVCDHIKSLIHASK